MCHGVNHLEQLLVLGVVRGVNKSGSQAAGGCMARQCVCILVGVVCTRV